MPHTLRLLPFTLLACLFLSACGSDDEVSDDDGQLVLGRTEVTVEETRGVRLGDRPLVLQGFNGAVRLDGTDGEVVELNFTKRARGNDETAAQNRLGDITIDEQGGEGAYTYTLRSSRAEQTAVDVEGTVPRGTSLRIELESGEVVLAGVNGPIEVQVENGNVRIGGATAGVRVQARSGNVGVGMQRLIDAEVNLQTQNGSLSLTLPASSDARVEASTDVGTISTEGELAFGSRDLRTSGAGGRFTGQVGQGTARVTLRTANGNIVLREGTVTRLPESTRGTPGSPSDAIEQGLTTDEPRTPIPMQDSLQEASPTTPDTSDLRPRPLSPTTQDTSSLAPRR